MVKQKQKKKSKRTNRIKVFYELISKHKLITFLLLLLLIPVFSNFYSRYKDWDNAQLITGLARDFPSLVSEIEQATGLNLYIKSDCMTTTEKYTSGVKSCDINTGYYGIDDANSVLPGILKNNLKFNSLTDSGSGIGYKIKYRNKNSCSMWFASSDRFYIECITAVREKNIQLAIDEFSKLKHEK